MSDLVLTAYTVKCTYFKDTGKYYADGETRMDLLAISDAWDYIREKNKNGGLPGLVESSRGWIILVEVPDHPHSHPKLILPDRQIDNYRGA